MSLFDREFRPLLAGKGEVLSLKYPVGATPKFDGIRVLIVDGVPVSRTLKPIRNEEIRKVLTGLPTLLDGEIIATSNSFQESTSAVMKADSNIPWEYHIFDYVDITQKTIAPYSGRMAQLRELFELGKLPLQCQIVEPDYIYEQPALEELCQQHLLDGYEGTMVRDPRGTYKCGRSTTREGILLKLKQFSDTEAVIIGFEELMHNDNEATVNALGNTERSTHKENLRGSGMLGAFVVHPIGEPDRIYKVGTGMTHQQRQDFWNKQDELLGELVKVKYFDQGIKDVPRFPVFLGFRDIEDM